MPESNRRRVIAVIDFADDENDVPDIQHAATWFEASLGRSAKFLDVTTYSSLAEAALDENERVGAFGKDATPLPSLPTDDVEPKAGP